MSEPRPSVVILAGPNGAGKSTAAPELLQGELSVSEFVNADVIARGLSAFDPDRAAIAAGRVMLGRLNELARQRATFAFETTLASRSFAPWLRNLRSSGGPSRLSLVVISRPGRPARRRSSSFGWSRCPNSHDSAAIPRRCQKPLHALSTRRDHLGGLQLFRPGVAARRGRSGVVADQGLR